MCKNLHICQLDKFIPPFLGFIRKEFSMESNLFYMLGDVEKYLYPVDGYVVRHEKGWGYLRLFKYMCKADKIILHNLLNLRVLFILACNPYLLKKCYWVIWGGDLYGFKMQKNSLKKNVVEFLKHIVFKRMGFLLTYIKGDVDLVRKHYKGQGVHLETIAYLSNVFTPISFNINEKNRQEECINILIGNSADPTNHHIEILNFLSEYKEKKIKIYAPLSYGNSGYAEQVIEYGKSIFGEQFIGMTDFMQYSDYVNFLTKIDIAIFNHNRQQAMGNTINLLGLGKTIYLRSDTSQWDFFKSKDIQVLDINDFNLENRVKPESNIAKVSQYFSYTNLKNQWTNILED